MLDTEEQDEHGRESLRLTIQVDTLLDVLCLYQESTTMTIKAAYVISADDFNESGDWGMTMDKMSAIWTGIDRRYKQTIYLYSLTDDEAPTIVEKALIGIKSEHIIYSRKLCSFTGDK
tara:strand:- start:737 stop:1090 length:354 start_codon:yes stop_codon:yes gene_type:complete